MTFNISAELNRTFHKAVEQHAASVLTKPEDWARHRTLQDRFTADRSQLQERFKAEYHDRVHAVRTRLIDEAGSLTHEHPTPTGTDRFNERQINKRAHAEVRREHDADLERSLNREIDALTELQDEVRARDAAQGSAEHAFHRAVDRRDGSDRRSIGRTR